MPYCFFGGSNYAICFCRQCSASKRRVPKTMLWCGKIKTFKSLDRHKIDISMYICEVFKFLSFDFIVYTVS